MPDASKKYVARELLNYLTGQETGYVAKTKEEREEQRIDLLNSLYYSWYGEDYAIVVSRAYDEIFVENNTAYDLSQYFKTYIGGEEVPEEELTYTMTYFDKDGNELSEAPSKAGTYYALAELIPSEEDQFGISYDYSTIWKLSDDECIVDYEGYGYVYNYTVGDYVGYEFWDPVTEVTLNDTAYHVPMSRGYVCYTIQPAKKHGCNFFDHFFGKPDKIQDILDKINVTPIKQTEKNSGSLK